MSIKRFVVLSDIHGDMQCEKTLDVAFRFIDDFKPHVRVCGGDVFDVRPLRGKADDDERRQSMAEDWGLGMKFLGDFKPHVLLLGNHDHRLYVNREKSSNGVIRDACAQAIVDLENKCGRLKCKILPYDARHGIYNLGDLSVVHGYFSGQYAAIRHAQTYGQCVFGHDHSISEFRPLSVDRRHARGIGCCCQLDMDYDITKPAKLRHENGFGYGWFNDKTGESNVFQARRIEDTWILATELKAYK